MAASRPILQLTSPVATSYGYIVGAWEALGIAFDVELPVAAFVDPEAALLATAYHAGRDRKLLVLVAAWLDEFSDLVHVERLLALLRRDRSVTESDGSLGIRVLGGWAHRLARSDRRWARIASECKALLERRHAGDVPENEDDSYLVKRDGKDPHFAAFGWKIPRLDRTDERSSRKKKLYLRDAILARNPWLRLRTVVGANWRADILFAQLFGLAENAHQVSKLLGCSYEAAHRGWQACLAGGAAAIMNIDALVRATVVPR